METARASAAVVSSIMRAFASTEDASQVMLITASEAALEALQMPIPHQ
jgi:hypothetical protein